MAELEMTSNAKTSDDSVPVTKIRINVSGTLFQCQQSIFSMFPLSRLSTLAAHEENTQADDNAYHFDRDPVIFKSILDAYRTGVLHVPNDTCGERFKQEVSFWGLPISCVTPCCWKVLHEANNNLSEMNQVTDAFLESVDAGFSVDGQLTARQKIWLLVEKPNSSRGAWIWAVSVAILVLVSTLLLCIQTSLILEDDESSFLVTPSENGSIDYYFEEPNFRLQYSRNDVVVVLELVTYVAIAAEIVVCLVTCQNWRLLLRSWMHLAEVIACVAFFFHFVVTEFAGSTMLLEYLKIVRLVRVLRVFTNVEEGRIISLTVRRSVWNVALFVGGFMFVTVFFAAGFYVSEYDNRYPMLDNIFIGMYLSIITATTVGYGDLRPITPIGYVIAGICALCGIFCIAIFVGGMAMKYSLVNQGYQAVKSHIRELQRLAPEGAMIRPRVNAPIVLMRLNGRTYSFKTVDVPRPGPGCHVPVQQHAQI